MDYCSSGDIKIPALGFGTWKLDGEDCLRATRCALEIGYRHIDTAQIYGNESEVGTAIKTSGISRDDIFLTTKIWKDNLRDGDLQNSVTESLRRLQTDYVDLLLIHWPHQAVPLDEQLRALQDVQKSGKARLIGVSNFPVALMREAVEECGVRIANNQVEYHPFLSQKPVLDYIRRHDMFLTAYSPLARGRVSDHPVLNEIASVHGSNAGQITLRWLIQQGHIAAIPKASGEAHIRANFDIFDFALSAEEMDKISALARPDGRMVNPADGPVWDKDI